MGVEGLREKTKQLNANVERWVGRETVVLDSEAVDQLPEPRPAQCL